MKTEKEIFNELFRKIPHAPEDRFDPLIITVSICEMAAKILYDAQNFNAEVKERDKLLSRGTDLRDDYIL